MLINTLGRVVSTSSGFVPDYLESLDDFEKAKKSADGIGDVSYTHLDVHKRQA